MAIDPNTGQPIPDVPTETPQTNQETQQPVEQPLFTSQSIEGGTYQGNIPAAVEKLKAAGISNPTEQQITDYFQLGGYYQVARDIEKAFKYPDQILSADGKPGKLEGESYSERSALQPVGDFNTANSYWDASRGVQVFAPAGQHFELYSNGAVKKVAGPVPVAGLTPGSKGGDNAPASSLFTQPTQADPNNPGGIRATPGFQQQQLGYQPIQGKTIETTGRSVFNPTTGVNEYAGPDEVLIKYTDGTVERRKVGAQPGQATPVGEFGRTPQELGITQDTGIKNEAGVQQPITRVPGSDASIQSQGLTGYANLEYIGPSYTTPDGKVRTAKEGNAFYQDPKSRTIVERQDRGQEASLQSTSQSVLAARQKLEGQIKSYLPNTDTTQLEQSFQDNPIKSFQDLYSSILEQQGVTTIKSEIESIQKEQEKLDNSFADEVQKINDNPYFSEAQRVDKIRVAQEKYDTKRSQLAARLTLQDSLLQESRQEAQYISSQALSQYNADRQFEQQQIEFIAQRADAAFDVEYKLRTLAAQEKNANLKELQGGLYDIGNKQWIVPPKEETLSPDSYARIIADVYDTYDPAEADQVIADITRRIGNPGQPLSIQSIVPAGQIIGTKFGEQTFAQAHHSGVDMPAPMGSPVLAPIDMKITSVGNAGGYGNSISAVDSSGYTYRFAHLSGYNVKAGDKVSSGQLIGKVGSTGTSTGPHLHMEAMNQNGQFVDPVQYFGLTSDSSPIKSKAEKKAEADKIEQRKQEAQKLSKELVSSDQYKAIIKAQESLSYLDAFEKDFKKYGTTSQYTSPFDNAKLGATYNAAVLNLKEFFNLGVLNGPDLDVIKSVLPDPTNQGLITNIKSKTATKAGITNVKSQINSTLDNRLLSLQQQYGGYGDEVTALSDVYRIYLNQKAILNPEIGQKINTIKKENPGLSNYEIIQLIL